MRSFQVMRCGRRAIPTFNESAQATNHSNTSTPTQKTRISMFTFDSISRSFDETDDSSINRRHTLNVQKPVTSSSDGYEYTRRGSFNNGRRLSFQQQEVTESTKSKTNLRNFYVFFVLLFLFIFLAVVYSFIRMIKNQTS